MAGRVVVALIPAVSWTPPGIDPERWRTALVEDVVDVLATLQAAEAAIAAPPGDRAIAEAVAWPGMPVYDLPGRRIGAALAAAVAAGHQQAAVVVADVPDVPGLLIGKLLQPLTTRLVSVAPAGTGRPGLFGLASRLPAPDWLPDLDLDTADPAGVRAAAPRPGQVAVTPAWRRVRGPADLATLDPALEGWEATRAVLGG